MTAGSYIVTFSCPNRPGIVAALAQTLYDKRGNIQEAHQYDDVETSNFFVHPLQFPRGKLHSSVTAE